MKRMIFLTFILMIMTAFSVYAGGRKDTQNTGNSAQNQNQQQFPDNRNGFVPPEGFEPPEGFTPGEGPWGRGGGNFGGRGGFPGFSTELPVNTAAENVSSRNIISDPDDTYSKSNFKSGVTINLNSMNVTYTGSADASSVTVEKNENGVNVKSTLKEQIFIELSGMLEGTFTVDSTEKGYAVILNGTSVTAKDGPALYLASKKRAFIVAVEGTKNILTDSAERNTNTKKGAVYVKGALVIADDDGDSDFGSIVVNGGYKHGIYSDDYIRFTGGDVSVSITARDAVRCVNGFIMDDGKLSILGTGSTTDEESKGIKVDGEESEKNPGEGFIVINGGDIKITTVSKGITAGFKVDEDAETETYADDPNPYVTINGGNIDITTTGKPYEYYLADGTKVNCSPEGIESKTDLTINGGNIKLRCPDDAINAAVSITINGGVIDVISSGNDAIDSNGSFTINGGTIYAIGSGDPETAFDCDNFPLIFNGGTVFGCGGSNTTAPASDSTANVIMYYKSVSKGSKVTVADSKGKVLGSYEVPQSCSALLFSSPELIVGETYTITVGSSSETVKMDANITTAGTSSFGGFGGRGGFGGQSPEGNFDGRGGWGRPDGNNDRQPPEGGFGGGKRR
ncbi:MAG: carbohydrate-binding domain-containing protein [Spirochaetaceae bacterium]|nr:carbohydrate-binding domain-containing protein [Spirochaetaceae bacterium]